MISLRLRTLFLIGIVVFIVHGIEEFVTGFYNIDRSFLLTVGKLGSNLSMIFIIYQLILWSLLGLAYTWIAQAKCTRTLSSVVGLVMLLELQHLYEVVVTAQYYPGAYTAILFPIIAYFFWKELIKNWRIL